MGSVAFSPSRSPADEAAKLKVFYGVTAPGTVEERSHIVRETLKTFDIPTLLSVIDMMGFPSGSAANIDLYRQWIEVWSGRSQHEFAVWYNLGVQFSDAGDKTNAITSYKNALALKSDLYQATLNLGTAFEAIGQADAALDVWSTGLQPDEARIGLLNNRGRVRENRKQYGEAEEDFTASLLTQPKQPQVLHHWIGLRTRMCAWPALSPHLPGVSLDDLLDATRALTLLALSDDIGLQDRGNDLWIREKMPPAPIRLSPDGGYDHRRLRIGYLSSDFCAHPMAYLVAELFETHDRDRFEVYGYCSTLEDGSEVRQRIVRSFDRFVDIRSMTDEQAARVIRDDEVDILIDLNGLTLGTRLQALRWRPAPVQMTWLGYNGPIPLPELDYIIADDFVIPPSAAPLYRPKPLVLPGCFQVNDSRLPVADPPRRQDVGLPEGHFVFCCFSNTYKITEQMFDCWMAILRRTDKAVLWLFSDNPYATKNLIEEAAKRGVDASRIIFATRTDPAQYRARLALADLFLDTFPYNAGTTASDALRAGLPLLTLSGASFISRMAGSLLSVLGLEECITYEAAQYVDLAVALGSDPVRYRDLRGKTRPEVWQRGLGDTARFCAGFESALTAVAVRAPGRGSTKVTDRPELTVS